LPTTQKNQPLKELESTTHSSKRSVYLKASQGAEEGLDLEQSFLGRDPPEPICTISTHHGWAQHLEEGSEDTHFPIILLSNKPYIPLSSTAHNLHIIRNWGILYPSNTKEIRKNFLQNRIPAPQIVPKFVLTPSPT
jgi:hypothetical protein